MYLDMVVPPGGILARISPEDGGQLLLKYNENAEHRIRMLK